MPACLSSLEYCAIKFCANLPIFSGLPSRFTNNRSCSDFDILSPNPTGTSLLILLQQLSFYLGVSRISHDENVTEPEKSVSRSIINSRANKEPEENTAAIAERWWKPFWKSTQHTIEKENIAILDRRSDLFPKAMQSKNSTSSLSLPTLTNHDQLYLDRGYEDHLKTKLVKVWSRWVVENMRERERDARNDCHEALANDTSEKAQWELTGLDCLVLAEWANREQALLMFSVKLEENLRLKMEECLRTIRKERNDGRLEQWMRSEFDVGRRKRLDKERGEAKKRMERAVKDWGERAEREGRSQKDQGYYATMCREGIWMVEARWSRGIRGGPEALGNEECMFHSMTRFLGFFSPQFKGRPSFVTQVHWRSQCDTERQEMDAALDQIRRVGGQREQMDIAYDYPDPDSQGAHEYVQLQLSSSKGRACSATVYDAYGCSAEDLCDVIKKSTTRSVINVDPDIVASIPPNDHLLFLSCYPNRKEPAFVQDNRDRWWRQQATNSALFYFTPNGVDYTSCHVSSGPIVQIFVFLAAPSRVRLHLLHSSRRGFSSMELKELGAGRHELQVVAVNETGQNLFYSLRDILIEFFMDDPTPVPASENDANETRPAIGAAYVAEEISSRSRDQSLCPPSDTQDSESYILSEDRGVETGV